MTHMQWNKLLWAAVASLSLAVGGELRADDAEARVAPGERELSTEQVAQIAQEQKAGFNQILSKMANDDSLSDEQNLQERLRSAAEELDPIAEKLDSVDPESRICGCGAYYGSGTFQHPVMIPPDGETVELMDGSIWHIRDCCRHCVRNWFPGDALAIAPNDAWFSSYPFKLVNMDSGCKAEAHMKWGPFVGGPYMRWILAIDYYNQEIWLNDGTHWCATSMDSSIFRQFLPDDTIIVGINQDWQAYRLPNILINVNLCSPKNAPYSYVRAVASF